MVPLKQHTHMITPKTIEARLESKTIQETEEGKAGIRVAGNFLLQNIISNKTQGSCLNILLHKIVHTTQVCEIYIFNSSNLSNIHYSISMEKYCSNSLSMVGFLGPV